jgi:hypothetical protein
MWNSILAENESALKQSVEETINYVDIDYDLVSAMSKSYTTHTRGIIEKNEYALNNAYRIWLQSGKWDYIRNPEFGGFFDNNLNDRFVFHPSSENAVREALISETAQKFPQVDIISVDVKCAFRERKWIVHVVLRDKNTGIILGIRENPVEVNIDDIES